jgi:hypothetical protein
VGSRSASIAGSGKIGNVRFAANQVRTSGVIQGTFGVIQGTFGVIQGTFGVIQETFNVI